MNILDIIIILLLAVFVGKGLLRGFIKEVVAFIGLPLSFILASSYSGKVADLLEKFISNSSYRAAVSFIVLFLLVYFLIAISGILLEKFITIIMAKPLNTILGGAVGLIKAGFLGSLLFLLVAAFAPSDSNLMKESKTWPLFEPWTKFMVELLPENLQKHFELDKRSVTDILKSKATSEQPLSDRLKDSARNIRKGADR